MKTLSVLLTLALFVATNQLAVHLRRAHALPLNHAQNADDTSAINPLTATRFPISQRLQ